MATKSYGIIQSGPKTDLAPVIRVYLNRHYFFERCEDARDGWQLWRLPQIMSDQHWPDAILETEWLALCWHMQSLLGLGSMTDIEPTVSKLRWADEQNYVELTSFVNVEPTILPTKCQCWPNDWLLSGHAAHKESLSFSDLFTQSRVHLWYRCAGWLQMCCIFWNTLKNRMLSFFHLWIILLVML